jgi:hypothetical protein
MKLYDAAGRDAYHCRLRDRPNSEISPERAVEAVTIARRFVSKMIELIETGTQGEQSFA